MLYRKRGKSKRMRSRSEMKNKLPATFVLLDSRIQQTTKEERRKRGMVRKQGRMRAEQRRCQRNFKRHLKPANMKLMAIILMLSLTQFPPQVLPTFLYCSPTQFNSAGISKEARSMKTIDERRNEKKGCGRRARAEWRAWLGAGAGAGSKRIAIKINKQRYTWWCPCCSCRAHGCLRNVFVVFVVAVVPCCCCFFAGFAGSLGFPPLYYLNLILFHENWVSFCGLVRIVSLPLLFYPSLFLSLSRFLSLSLSVYLRLIVLSLYLTPCDALLVSCYRLFLMQTKVRKQIIILNLSYIRALKYACVCVCLSGCVCGCIVCLFLALSRFARATLWGRS